MIEFKYELLDESTALVPGLHLVITDLTSEGVVEYLYQVVAQQLGHTMFQLVEEVTE